MIRERKKMVKFLQKKFNIQAYPTFLLLNTDQGLENQIVGATIDPLEFKKLVEEAMSASIASLEKQYKEGNRESFFPDKLFAGIIESTNDYRSTRSSCRTV